MKKSASQFLDDLLAGDLFGLPSEASQQEVLEAFTQHFNENYDFTQEEFEQVVRQSKDRLEAAVGVPLTDEQLVALSGGKSEGAKIGIGVGSAVGGSVALGAVGGGIVGAVAFFVVFK